MALAASPYETRIAEILRAAPAPMTSAEVLAELRARFGMRSVRKCDVNAALYGAASYGAVPNCHPPRWYLQGQQPPPAAYPPPEVVPGGEFDGRAVAVGGDSDDYRAAAAAVALLWTNSPGVVFRCDTSLAGGRNAEAAALAAEAPEVEDIGRRGAAPSAAAREAFAAGLPAALVLIGGAGPEGGATARIRDACEAMGIPVYQAAAPAGGAPPAKKACGAC